MDTKKYFDDPQTIVSSTDIETLAKEVESYKYMEAYIERKEKFVPRIDFTSASNFAFFGSAEQYYDDAIKRIYQSYPYDGSLYEKTAWHFSSSYLDEHIFEQEYPRTNGFIRLAAKDESDPWIGTASDNYYSASAAEYILFRGGPHTSDRTKGKPITDETGDYKSGYSNIYDQSKNRESNLKIDGGDGNTVEFWMKKTAIVASTREVIFDTYTANATEAEAGHGRMAIEIFKDGSEDTVFNVTYISASSGFQTASIGQNINSNFSDDKWHHYAFTFANSGSNLQAKLYVDGICNNIITGSEDNLIREQATTTIDYVSGGMYATVGALATSPRGNSTPQLGWAPLSASLDEFRFWKTTRNAQQIGRHWFTQVGGGTNTDDANTHLGVYYKFNEGVTGDPLIDASVLDYSGRINNGTWIGYTSGHRSTESAIVLSNLATASYEFKDPILYAAHPDVDDYSESSLEKGRHHDLKNSAYVYNSLPNWIIDEDSENGYVLKKLVQIMSSYFDTLYLQAQLLPTIQNIAYPSGSQNAYPFIRQALESKGFVTSEIFADATILEQFLNQTDKELFEEKLYNVKNQIYQNVYNSLSRIYKTKGTEKSFRNLIRCFGVDDEVLKLNIYGNQVDYTLEDNFSFTTVKKGCIDFNRPSRYQGTVYQFTSSQNSMSFISGSKGAAILHTVGDKAYQVATPFTTEAEFIFPKRLPQRDAINYSYSNLSASLFGMHTARQTTYEDTPSNPVDYNDLAPPHDDIANFEVYACRKTHDETSLYSNGYTNRDVFFMFTSSNDNFALELTSSVFVDVYEDTKWNFAVRVLPNKYPLAGYISGTLPSFAENASEQYRVEFYGLNTNADVVSNEFLLTGTLSKQQGELFLSSSKRVYAGAHRTNFTGSLITGTDVKFSSLRCWLDYLDNKTIQAHSRDPKNIGRLHPYQNTHLFDSLPQDAFNILSPHPYVPQMETLILNWDMTGVTGSGPSNSNSYYGVNNNNGSFLVKDMSSGSIEISSSYGWASEVAHMNHPGKGDFFLPSKTNIISKEYIYSAKQNQPENLHSSDMVKIVKTDDITFTRQTLPTTHFFAIEKSMYQTISEEILKFFATIIDFNNLIGEPINRYRQDYKIIGKLRQLFFERKTENDTGEIVNPDLEKYIDYYRWIDQSISQMIQQIIPASSRFSEDIRNMIESHILERNKYWSKLPIIEEKIKHTKVPLAAPLGSPTPRPRPKNEETGEVGDTNPITVGSHPFPFLTMESPGKMSRYPNRIANPNTVEKLKEIGPTRMTVRLPDSANWTKDDQNTNTLAWVGSKKTDPALTSNDSTIDEQRKKLFDAVINTRQRSNRAPVRLYMFASEPLHAGVNSFKNKNPDLFRALINTSMGSEARGLEISTGSVEENIILKEYKNLVWPEEKKREYLTTSRIKSRSDRPNADKGESDYFGDTYSKFTVPFTIISSSVETGYKSVISTYFTGGIDFTNLHQDIYAPHYEVPLQGPFTKKWVGGFPHRHVWSQFSGSSQIGSNLDDITNRVEGWRLVFKEDTQGKYAQIVSPMSASKSHPRSMIWHGPKRPVNIKNIQITTGSGGYRDPKNATKIGNYTFDYNIISTSGRSINNRYLTKNKEINPDWQGYQKPDSWDLPIMGVSTFTTIDRAITGSNDFVFVNRFNAPGGPETMCEAFLDLEAAEYSLYNCLNYRNLSVRLPLREYLTNHSNKFGFWSDAQYSASWESAFVDGIVTAYAGNKTTETSDNYRGTSTSGQTLSSYHNVHRNKLRRVELSGTSPHGTLTGSVYDNYWVQHPIPRTDLQYSWITASVPVDYSGYALYGYEQKNTNNIRNYRPNASTTLQFLTAGEISVDGLSVDFAGLNTLIYDPINVSLNLLSASNNDYRNTSIASLTQPKELNGLIHHRNGPYGWPSWKQMRMANHPIARYERKNSILSFMYHNKLNRFSESLATGRYKPLVHVFKEGAIEHTYGNNLANFSNVEVRDKLNFDIHSNGDQTYDHIKNLYLKDIISLKPELISFYYREVLYPREINVYLKKARMRENYNVDFWRETRSKRTDNNITNSQGQTILKQSMWPLDARESFATADARGRADSAGNDGAGELLNNYTIYLATGSTHPKITPAALYARPLSGSDASTGEDVVSGDTKFETGNPFYNSYEEYSDDIKRVGQNYSIVSEFRMSEHMPYYLDDKNGNFFADRDQFLECSGATYANSTVDNFFKTYSHTDFLKYFNVMYSDHEGILEPNKITLTCHGIKKLLPYKGFYPAERTLQLATLFSQSYSSTEFVSDSYSDNAKRRISLAPFFAPGILYNSIKSGIAVDYPIYTKQPGSTTAGGTVTRTTSYALGTLGNASRAGEAYRLSGAFDFRLPFDSLVRPEAYIGNGNSIYEAEPDITARLSGSTLSTEASAVATGSVKLDQVKSDTYKLAMHNFLATSIDLFLKGGEVSSLVSSKLDDSYYVNPRPLGGTYKMRFYLTDHQNTSQVNTRTFSMYNRESAFGPEVHHCPDSTGNRLGGYAPFTPSYYYNNTQTGYSYIEYSFTPWKHTVAEKYGTEGSDEYTLDEIISNSTITPFRSVDKSQLSGSSSGNNYVQDIDMMSLTSSVSIFQKDGHLIAQPRWETPIFNFNNVTRTSATEGDAAATKGMWHQKGIYETDNRKGIFFGALDVEGNESLADLIQMDKGLKKIGLLPDDNEKVIREAVVAIPIIKKYNKRTKKVETKLINVNKNMVKRAISSIISGQPPEGVSSSVFNMVKSMSRYVIPPKFDFLTQLKKFGSKAFRPFAMYFFEFEHELSQEDISNIWQNIQPSITTSFEKEKVSICHSLERGELLTIKELKNPDLHWMIFKVKQKAKWNYFDKVIDLAGQLPPSPDAGQRLLSVQLGNETTAPLASRQSEPNPYVTAMGGAPNITSLPTGDRFATNITPSPAGSDRLVTNIAALTTDQGDTSEGSTMPTHATNTAPTMGHFSQISSGASNQLARLSSGQRLSIDDAIQYARQESDIASGYGLDYSYNWPYDYCSLVELIKLDTEVHLGGGDSVQITPITGPDGKEETVVVSGRGARRAVPDDIREEAPAITAARTNPPIQQPPRPTETVIEPTPETETEDTTGYTAAVTTSSGGQTSKTIIMIQQMIQDYQAKLSGPGLSMAEKREIEKQLGALKKSLALLLGG